MNGLGQQPTVQNQEPKPSFLKAIKWRIVFPAVIVIVVVLAGGSFLIITKLQGQKVTPTPNTEQGTPPPLPQTSPQPDLTESWKQYKNNDLKFHLKYPGSWEIKEFDQKNLTASDTQAQPVVSWTSGGSGKQLNVSIAYYKPAANVILTDFVKEREKTLNLTNDVNSQTGSNQVGGVSGIMWIYSVKAQDGKTYVYETFYIPKEDKLWEFTASTPKTGDEGKTLQLFGVFLATFRFD